MSTDDLWCSWCRQPHAPCATTPAMEAERAATLRARLEKRYEPPDLGALDNGEPVRTLPQRVWRVVDGVGAWWWFWPDTDCFGALVGEHEHPAYPRPERPCTYDPADEEPEAEPVATRLGARSRR